MGGWAVQPAHLSAGKKLSYTAKNDQVVAILMKTGLNNVVRPRCLPLSTMLNNIVTADSGSTILFNVNNVGRTTLFNLVKQQAHNFYAGRFENFTNIYTPRIVAHTCACSTKRNMVKCTLIFTSHIIIRVVNTVTKGRTVGHVEDCFFVTLTFRPVGLHKNVEYWEAITRKQSLAIQSDVVCYESIQIPGFF